MHESLSVVGTWSLIEAWDVDAKAPGGKLHPWGDPPAGYWVFDRSGRFSLMIAKNPPLPPPAAAFPSRDTPHELFVETFAVARPYAYFGTYTIEPDPQDPERRGTLVLAVTADVLRAYNGTTQRRKFAFDGPDYIEVGDPAAYLRRLRRITG
ncbi:MAG TPA: lipocalin-like domain-containing protein [Polyangiales bacterium]|jgi:hypothetical protein|nr:lipocalin-like domain-containing protein [Polyangiales bacterium]